jgi:hypothetical protein
MRRRAVWDEVSKPVLAQVTIGVVSIDAGPAARILAPANATDGAIGAMTRRAGPSVLTAGLVPYFNRRYPPVQSLGNG